MNSTSLVNCFVQSHQYLEKFAFFFFFFGGGGVAQEFYHRFMYIAPSSGCSLLTLKLNFKVMSSENAALFDRLMKIHSDLPIL